MTLAGSPIGRILAASSSILLDFDGPVCSIFSGLTDVAVSDRLRGILARAGVDLDDAIQQTTDPLAVLIYASTRADRAVLAQVESNLIAAEVEAAASASPARSAEQFIRAAAATGRSVGIVSNNSAEAINAYLDLHQLTPYVAAVVGRQRERPELMKPNSFPVEEALRQLSDVPENAVLIGDSAADEGAAQAARVAFIGYAETTTQLDRLDGANVLVRSMEELLASL